MVPSPSQEPRIPRQGRAADHARRATSLRRLANPNPLVTPIRRRTTVCLP